MLFCRFRWFCRLFLAFSLVHATADAKQTRGQVVCRSLVAGALVGVTGWWVVPGGVPKAPPLIYSQTTPRTQAGPDLAGARFDFTPVLETRILTDGWLAQSVALRVKAQLAKDKPEMGKLEGWKDPGIRVPVNTILFQPQSDGSIRVVAKSPFMTLKSSTSICLESLSTGSTVEVEFFHERTTQPGEGAQLAMRLALHYEDGQIRVVAGSGTFRVYGSNFFQYEEAFTIPEWRGERVGDE